MQNTEKIHKNPSFHAGMWAEHTLRPGLGAGQVQLLAPDGNLCVIEHWESGQPSDLIYPMAHLRPAEYLYMGHSNNVLCYVHQGEVRKVAFSPTSQVFTADDFDELQIDFTTRWNAVTAPIYRGKAYLQAAHVRSQPIDADDIEYVVDYWLSTGGKAFKHLIPYVFGPYSGQFQANLFEVVAA